MFSYRDGSGRMFSVTLPLDNYFRHNERTRSHKNFNTKTYIVRKRPDDS